MNLRGRLVSQQKGEYAGPCPFTGQGEDRFHWWPNENKWWCRKECPNCPGQPAAQGRWGWLDKSKLESPQTAGPPQEIKPPSLELALEYARMIDTEVLTYLAGRGIQPQAARRFVLGRHGQRVTIPNIVQVKGKAHCLGIKKRWLGEITEPWIERYLMEPGSKGAAIFNWNRLISRPKDTVLIVEGILDVIMLDGLGITAVAPFGGGGIWRPDWSKWFSNAKEIIIVADNDTNGTGIALAERKRNILGRGIVTLPPNQAKDIGEAWQSGSSITTWVQSIAR